MHNPHQILFQLSYNIQSEFESQKSLGQGVVTSDSRICTTLCMVGLSSGFEETHCVAIESSASKLSICTRSQCGSTISRCLLSVARKFNCIMEIRHKIECDNSGNQVHKMQPLLRVIEFFSFSFGGGRTLPIKKQATLLFAFDKLAYSSTQCQDSK